MRRVAREIHGGHAAVNNLAFEHIAVKHDAALVLHEGRERKANRRSRLFQKKRIGSHRVPPGGGGFPAAAQRARHDEAIDRLAHQREAAFLRSGPHGLVAHRDEGVGSSGDVPTIEPQAEQRARGELRCMRRVASQRSRVRGHTSAVSPHDGAESHEPRKSTRSSSPVGLNFNASAR